MGGGTGSRLHSALRCLWLLGLFVLLWGGVIAVSGCQRPGDTAKHQPPVDVQPGDTCAVCGMYIAKHPGPRAEAYLEGQRAPLKFGGLMDFFTYIRDPEVSSRLQTLYVQDVARIDWKHPSMKASSFTDARKAWYVAGQPLCGEMGPTLASFARKADAEAFARRQGGRVVAFRDVNEDLLRRVRQGPRSDPSCRN